MMKFWKKLSVLFLAFVLTFAFAACDSTGENQTEGEQNTTNQTDGSGSGSGDTTGGDTTGGDTTGGDTSGGDTTGGDTTGGDTSGGDTSGGDTSGGDTSGGDTTGGDTSGGDTTGGDTSGGDTSGGDTSGGDTTGGDTTGGDTSGGDTSGSDTAGGDTTGGDTSGGDTSGGDTSGGTSIAVTASEVLSALLDRPDPWSFFPEAMTTESLAYTSSPISDFSSFVNVSSISSKFIGQELSVLYSGISTAETVLTVADVIFSAGQALGTLYQSFLDSSPDNYKLFTGSTTIAGVTFSFQIELDGNNYSLLAKGGAICIELYTDGETDTGRIQITNGAVLKYVSTENTLRFAVEFSASILGYTGMFTQDFTFARDTETNVVSGYMFEYLGTDSGTGTELANAFYYSDSNYTAVMADAKDSGSSLTLNSYLELYSSATGKFVGARVLESVPVTKAEYDTYWFNLYDVSGITTVRATDEENGDNSLNANSVYLNGSSTALAVEWNTLFTKKTSRKYDIELKTVEYVIAGTDEDGETTYTSTEYQIPMLFVQADELTSFSTDIVSNNSGTFSTTPVLPSYTAINTYFTLLDPYYEKLVDEVDYNSTVSFIGEANSFFA